MSVVFHSSSFTRWNFLFTIQVYKLTVVHEGEPMLGRHNGRLVISTFWFVTSSLVLSSSLRFFGEDSNGLLQEVMLTLTVLVNVVAIERSIFVIWGARSLPFNTAAINFCLLP